jgi:hypothetical protein
MTVNWRRSTVDAGAGAPGPRTNITAQRCDGSEEPAPMSNEVDAKVLQVVGGQLGQYRGVDRIVSKRLFVLL